MMHPEIELLWKFATVEASSEYGFLFGRVFAGNNDKDLKRKMTNYFDGSICEEQIERATIDELKRGYSFVSDEPSYGCPRYHVRIFDSHTKFIGHLSFIGFEEEFLFRTFDSVDDANSLFAFVDAVNDRYSKMIDLC